MPLEKPHSDEAERAVIRCLLEEPDLFYTTKLTLLPHMFFNKENKVVYNVITNFISEGQTPDGVLVVNKLKSQRIFEDIGGEEYFSKINNIDFLTSNYETYLSQVFDDFLCREIISAGNRVVNAGYKKEHIEAADTLLSESSRILDIAEFGADTLSVSDLMAEEFSALVERMQNPGNDSIKTGFRDYDMLTGGLHETDEIIIAARPSVGKTALALRWMLNLAKQEYPCLFFSYEMSRKQIMQRFLSMESRVNLSKIRTGMVTVDDYDAVADAANLVGGLPMFISNDVTASPTEVVSGAQKLVRKEGVEIVFVDYLQLMPHRTKFATQDLGAITRKLKNLAMDSEVTVILISQLNRNVELRKSKIPILSDLRQSGNIEEHADVVLMLYRDEMYNPTPENKGLAEMHIRKNRNGPIGKLPLIFDAGNVNYTQPVRST